MHSLYFPRWQYGSTITNESTSIPSPPLLPSLRLHHAHERSPLSQMSQEPLCRFFFMPFRQEPVLYELLKGAHRLDHYIN